MDNRQLVSHYAGVLGKTIGQNMKSARKAKGLSLEKLAAKVKPPTSYQQISRLEQGKMLSIEWIEKIAQALGMDPMELIRGQALANDLELSEQVANEIARTLAVVARDGVLPENGTVQALSLMLQELAATFLKHPQAYRDPQVARPVLDLLSRRSGHAAN
jgi:transcriptional regulator with XRE-family HTH domain